MVRRRKGRRPGISLFSGAGGLDLGLQRCGIDFRAWVEVDRWARETLCANFACPGDTVFGDLTQLDPGDLVKAAGLAQGDAFVVAGGPPCQAFSTAGRRRSVRDKRGLLVNSYFNVVAAVRPRFFVFENVRGLLSAALRHRPLAERGPDHPDLMRTERHGTVLRHVILPRFERLGYEVIIGVLDAADFGIAQRRRRVFMLGSRDHEFRSKEFEELFLRPITLQDLVPPTHGDGRKPWVTLRQVFHRMPRRQEHAYYSPTRAEIYGLIPEGQNWRYIRDNPSLFPRGFLRAVMGGALDSTGGRVGFWRRLAWNEPSPTLMTSPVQKATGLCHPSKARPLSVQEYMRVQDFPDDFDVRGPLSARYRQLGNAVPVSLGYAVGQALCRSASGRPWKPVRNMIIPTTLPPRRALIREARGATQSPERAVAAARSRR